MHYERFCIIIKNVEVIVVALDIISIIFLVIITLGGYSMGFGRALKALTNGPIGFMISIAVCILFGGAFQHSSAVIKLINYINTQAIALWSFLKYLQPGYVVYYLALFLVVQFIRIITINTIAQIDYSQNKVAIAINKILGGALCLAFIIAVTLLVFAIFNLFEDVEFVTNILDKISGSYLYVVYKNNPISFS